MKLELSREEKNKLIEEIQRYFYDERGEEIGIIAAGNVLQFFDKYLGEAYYNKALDEARVWFKKRMEDVEIDFDLLYKNR